MGSGEDRPPPPAAKPNQEWRGVAHRNLRQEWRGTNHTTHQPQPHQHTTAAHHTPHTTHHTPHTTAGSGTPARSGGEPHTTTGSETQPGVAGSSTQEPLPGVARGQPHHTPATTRPTHHRRTPHTRNHTPHTNTDTTRARTAPQTHTPTANHNQRGRRHTNKQHGQEQRTPPPPAPPPHLGETGNPPSQTTQRNGGRDKKGPRETQARDPTSGVWGHPRSPYRPHLSTRNKVGYARDRWSVARGGTGLRG